MSLQQSNRSTYRDRRINVMLQESANNPPSAPQPWQPKKITRTQRNARTKVISISVATAALCACAVFVSLFHRETAQTIKNVPSQPVQTPVALNPTPAVVVPPPVPAPAPVASAQRLHFLLKRHNRSQTVGPINLKLVAFNATRGICSLTISTPNAKPVQRTLQVNRSIELPAADDETVSVLISAISKDSVSGYVTDHKS